MGRKSESDRVRAALTIDGKVQGVCFRFETQRQAERLGLGGWVMNLPDGRVEAVVEGREEAVEELIAWCHRGPTLARVREVRVTRQTSSAAESEFEGFSIRY